MGEAQGVHISPPSPYEDLLLSKLRGIVNKDKHERYNLVYYFPCGIFEKAFVYLI